MQPELLKSENLKAIQLTPATRVLKIEADGDRWKGIKPKIRLIGRWLERAGFRPGHRVQITFVAPGIIELRSSDAEHGETMRYKTQPSES